MIQIHKEKEAIDPTLGGKARARAARLDLKSWDLGSVEGEELCSSKFNGDTAEGWQLLVTERSSAELNEPQRRPQRDGSEAPRAAHEAGTDNFQRRGKHQFLPHTQITSTWGC